MEFWTRAPVRTESNASGAAKTRRSSPRTTAVFVERRACDWIKPLDGFRRWITSVVHERIRYSELNAGMDLSSPVPSASSPRVEEEEEEEWDQLVRFAVVVQKLVEALSDGYEQMWCSCPFSVKSNTVMLPLPRAPSALLYCHKDAAQPFSYFQSSEDSRWGILPVVSQSHKSALVSFAWLNLFCYQLSL